MQLEVFFQVQLVQIITSLHKVMDTVHNPNTNPLLLQKPY